VTQVRIGRQEAKKQKTAREKQTRQRQKKANRERTFSVSDMDYIFAGHGVPSPEGLRYVFDELLAKFRGDSVPESEFDERIFDSTLTDLRNLPIGMLGHKEVVLTPDLIDACDSPDKLTVLCKRMIIRNEDPDLIDTIINRWPGRGPLDEKLERHVAGLWQLRRVEPRLYGAVVGGQHDEVRWHCQRVGLPFGFDENRIIRLLVCHGLLWCTNDIQLMLARNAIIERNPLGALVSDDHRILSPDTVVTNFKPYYSLMRLALDYYVTGLEAQNGRDSSPMVEKVLQDDPIASNLRIQIKHEIVAKGIDVRALRSKLDDTVPHLRSLLERAPRAFRRALEKPVKLEKEFHAIWFTGLSNLQSAAVPLIRYVQAESELETLVRDRWPSSGRSAGIREGVALPAFSKSRMPEGWRSRVLDLLYFYRKELLQDMNFKGKGDAERGKNAGGKSVDKAALFLAEQGERRIGDFHGDENSKTRTYYLLDIIPEARLSRQFDMVLRNH
jgi:hypothetical protein